MTVEVEVKLDEFCDEDLLEEIRTRIDRSYNDNFKEELIGILKKEFLDSNQVLNDLESLHVWNPSYAKEWFETLPFSKSLKKWILKTYKDELV